MKIFFVLVSVLFFVGCTAMQDLGLKNIALRHSILAFDGELAKMTDQVLAKQIKAQTKIDVVNLEKTSDTQAVVTLKVVSVSPKNLAESQSREEKVFLQKKDDWEVVENKN